jgi:hypothetical protein
VGGALLVCALNLMSQTPPPVAEPEGAAKLVSFTGQVSVLRSNYSWALNVGSFVKRQEVIVTGPDGWGVFQVSDGSTFEVFPNGQYVFRANQGDWRDLLEVWLGKVRVQIESARRRGRGYSRTCVAPGTGTSAQSRGVDHGLQKRHAGQGHDRQGKYAATCGPRGFGCFLPGCTERAERFFGRGACRQHSRFHQRWFSR